MSVCKLLSIPSGKSVRVSVWFGDDPESLQLSGVLVMDAAYAEKFIPAMQLGADFMNSHRLAAPARVIKRKGKR